MKPIRTLLTNLKHRTLLALTLGALALTAPTVHAGSQVPLRNYVGQVVFSGPLNALGQFELTGTISAPGSLK